MHALIPCQHTGPLWKCTSPSPSPSLHPGYACAAFIASLLAAHQPSKALCEVEKAEVTPLSPL